MARVNGVAKADKVAKVAPAAKVNKAGKSGKKQKISFCSHLWRLGRKTGAQHADIGPGAAMPKKTVQTLDDMVQEAIGKFCGTLQRVVEYSGKTTLKPAHVVAAIKLDMKGYDGAVNVEAELKRIASIL